MESSLYTRQNMVNEIRYKYPDRVPVIVDRYINSDLPVISKHKFIVPYDITMSNLLSELKVFIPSSHGKVVFLFVNDILPSASAFIGEVYDKYKNEDGFLYLTYCGENDSPKCNLL